MHVAAKLLAAITIHLQLWKVHGEVCVCARAIIYLCFETKSGSLEPRRRPPPPPPRIPSVPRAGGRYR